MQDELLIFATTVSTLLHLSVCLFVCVSAQPCGGSRQGCPLTSPQPPNAPRRLSTRSAASGRSTAIQGRQYSLPLPRSAPLFQSRHSYCSHAAMSLRHTLLPCFLVHKPAMKTTHSQFPISSSINSHYYALTFHSPPYINSRLYFDSGIGNNNTLRAHCLAPLGNAGLQVLSFFLLLS
ncbi:hypothetical protein E2C01_018632 [Portunus trituberculatus]|uniref:Secreted protein n=1 Tax=Portunus trituberculatus TaxID=210409 RepID=A0A5B7DW59_PORTR|nr:hypothetical protein [Portunus trituberculatus]